MVNTHTCRVIQATHRPRVRKHNIAHGAPRDAEAWLAGANPFCRRRRLVVVKFRQEHLRNSTLGKTPDYWGLDTQQQAAAKRTGLNGDFGIKRVCCDCSVDWVRIDMKPFTLTVKGRDTSNFCRFHHWVWASTFLGDSLMAIYVFSESDKRSKRSCSKTTIYHATFKTRHQCHCRLGKHTSHNLVRRVVPNYHSKGCENSDHGP